jgi:hypothetical protein
MPKLIPEVESVLAATSSKFQNAMNKISRMKVHKNLTQAEWRALKSLQRKNLTIIPSDKGGNFCISHPDDYKNAVVSHLGASRVYRRLSGIDISKVENGINQAWRSLCQKRKIPRHVETHYLSSCSTLPTFKGLIKTHKPSPPMKIRPVINSIDGPTYKLSWLFQKILQKFANSSPHSVSNSDSIINHLKSQPMEILNFHSFPISLDIVDMYTSIPAEDAVNVLYNRMIACNFRYFGLLPGDIRDLLRLLLNNNYFRYENLFYKQMFGLPMGSKLSGLLADIFIDSLEVTILGSLPTPLYYRYVDDCLVIVQSKDTAMEILQTFNSLHRNIKYEIEFPNNDGSLSLLDFTLRIKNGIVDTSPYTKPIKSGIFMNGMTSLPSTLKDHVISNEWNRIKSKCANRTEMRIQRECFQQKLTSNQHQKFPALRFNERRKASSVQKPIFYLNIPFISDECNTLIKRALQPIGFHIRLSHRSKQLKEYFKSPSPPASFHHQQCKLRDCPLKGKLCFMKLIVYQITCNSCQQFYIGSTKKHFHLRIKEHMSMKQSNLFQHKSTCNGNWSFKILSRSQSVADMRMKEAILINELHPTINKKEVIFSISNFSLI